MGRPQPKKKSDYSRRTGVVTAVFSAVFCCRSCLSSPPTQTRTYQSTNFPVDYSSLFFLLLPLRLETSATSNKLRPNGNAIEAKSGKLLCLAYTRDGKRRRVGYWGFTKDFPDRSIAIQRLACASIRLLEKKNKSLGPIVQPPHSSYPSQFICRSRAAPLNITRYRCD